MLYQNAAIALKYNSNLPFKSQAMMAARVIAQKRVPALTTARSEAWLPWHVLAHRARRDSNAELDQQFVRDPLLVHQVRGWFGQNRGILFFAEDKACFYSKNKPTPGQPRRAPVFPRNAQRCKLCPCKPGKQALDILSGDRPMIVFTKTA